MPTATPPIRFALSKKNALTLLPERYDTKPEAVAALKNHDDRDELVVVEVR